MAGFNQRKSSTPSKTPASARKNTSLLNFFQKTDGPPKSTSRQPRITQFATKSDRAGSDSSGNNGRSGSTPGLRRGGGVTGRENGDGAGGLFLEDRKVAKASTVERARSTTPDDFWDEHGPAQKEEEEERFNENGSASKRRKVVSHEPESRSTNVKPDTNASAPAPAKQRSVSGPFIDESDSEEDMDALREFEEEKISTVVATDSKPEPDPPGRATIEEESQSKVAVPPSLVREATSHITDDEYTNFDDVEDDQFRFQDEEEFLEPLDDDNDNDEGEDGLPPDFDDTDGLRAGEEPVCPICQARLIGLGESDISVHVNNCLDGKPNDTPSSSPQQKPTKAPTRADLAAIARPAQRDPYSSGGPAAKSAFSKLMAGNAEDSAWSVAAANEVTSRGKQAYQRTCPFYKILPGFSICVDAFRYGAVEGCNAYFLSHFHSDHYIGLTASWRHGPIYCSKPTANLVRQQLKVDRKWLVVLDFERKTEVPYTGGVQVTLIEANHCPGSALFLFEKPSGHGPYARAQRVLHCGDFRASPLHVQHALLSPNPLDPDTGQRRQQRIDACYLDTTYMSPKYAFPSQEDVIQACADFCVGMNDGDFEGFGPNSAKSGGGMMSRFFSTVTGNQGTQNSSSGARGRLLVVIGTYSIGKERICLGIARALKSKIYATAAKQRVCACLEDEELSSLLTDNPREAQVHMQTLFEIRADTLADYLDSLKPHFGKVVGFRPTGWSYRPPAGRMLDNPPVSAVLHSAHWKTPFSAADLVPQRGSTRESACFGVPYSEHSSFRELTMFCCALRIGRVIPTVNVGSRKSRERMKAWIERWEAEKRKSGLYRVEGMRW